MGTKSGSRTVAIGIQDFGSLISKNCFYVDKTDFIREWWESNDSVTLITRPRRFGKTLNISMLEYFFSNRYAGQGALFEGLSIWNDEEYRELQGTYPVISLSFASVKERELQPTKICIYQLISDLYSQHSYLLQCDALQERDKKNIRNIIDAPNEMDDITATRALHKLSEYLFRYYGKRVIILLDEYDTPMQEAYVNGFWDELVAFTRSMFNSTFKTNPYLERAMMTGITRVSKESIFSDLNNLKVVTTTSEEYATAFGFTEAEVFAAMDEMGLSEKEQVKQWYDGFVFGSGRDIYNPWSIINYLDTGKLATYWANTSANGLVGKLIREGSSGIKETFESLLAGETITVTLDEQIVYNQLDDDEDAIWSLLLASGYLKVVESGEFTQQGENDWREPECILALTNLEVRLMFENMVRGWFKKESSCYNDFIKALLLGDRKAMNAYMNRVALSTFSYFDTGNRPSGAEPERLPIGKASTSSFKIQNSCACFYHGFVLGLMVDLRNRYVITSNRESGFGRYDVMLEPKEKADDAIIIEFKVYDGEDEKNLSDTVAAALAQIEEKNYAAVLVEKGVPETKIRKYGFAFEGKNVLIG